MNINYTQKAAIQPAASSTFCVAAAPFPALIRGSFGGASSARRDSFGAPSTVLRGGFDPCSTPLRGCSACNPLRSEDVRGIPEGVPNQSRRTVKANGKTTAMSAEYNVADSAASPAAKNDTMSGFCNPTCTLYVKLQIIGTVQGLAQPLIHLKR